MKKSLKNRALQLLNLPTAPFDEHFILEAVSQNALKAKRPVEQDPYGNLLIKSRPGKPALIFVTHADHPAFRLIDGKDKDWTLQILGGLPRHLLAGAKVKAFAEDPTKGVKGQLGKRIQIDSKGRPDNARGRMQATIKVHFQKAIDKNHIVWLDLPKAKIDERWVQGVACDNLLNTAILMELFADKKFQPPINVCHMLTRCEEVGMLGMIAAHEAKATHPKVPHIVLEASSVIPAVKPGKGAILRVGDLVRMYDPDIEARLQSLRIKHGAKIPLQRALMDGGGCEAAILAEWKFPTGALALPLVNYHNNAKTRLAREKVMVKDVESMMAFLKVIAYEFKDAKARQFGPALLKKMKAHKAWLKI